MRLGDKRKAAFFDVDGVVYASIIGVDFMKYLKEKHLLDRTTMRAHAPDLADLARRLWHVIISVFSSMFKEARA
jgi:hypothetical protein